MAAPDRAVRFARVVLGLSALPFVGIGLGFWLAPAALGARVDLDVVSNTALNDVRAVYGGLQLGVGVLLALCAWRPGWHELGLVALLLTFGGLAAARFWSLAADGPPDPLGFVLHAGELGALAFGAAAWRLLGGWRMGAPPG